MSLRRGLENYLSGKSFQFQRSWYDLIDDVALFSRWACSCAALFTPAPRANALQSLWLCRAFGRKLAGVISHPVNGGDELRDINGFD
jgi:hypothetical protein